MGKESILPEQSSLIMARWQEVIAELCVRQTYPLGKAGEGVL